MTDEMIFRLVMTFVFFAIMVKMQLQVRRIMVEMRTIQKREVAERAAAIVEVKKTADALARKAAMIAESVKDEAEQATAELKREINKNTEITQDAADKASAAYEVGNHVQENLKRLGLEQNALLKDQKEQKVIDRAQADSIQETGEDSNQILKDAAVLDLASKAQAAANGEQATIIQDTVEDNNNILKTELLKDKK